MGNLVPFVKKAGIYYRGAVELDGSCIWTSPEKRKKREEAVQDAMDYIREASR